MAAMWTCKDEGMMNNSRQKERLTSMQRFLPSAIQFNAERSSRLTYYEVSVASEGVSYRTSLTPPHWRLNLPERIDEESTDPSSVRKPLIPPKSSASPKINGESQVRNRVVTSAVRKSKMISMTL